MNVALRATALLTLVLVSGCGAPWIVLMRSGPPSALRGAPALNVSYDVTATNVDGAPLGMLPPGDLADVQGALQQSANTFLGEVAARAGVPVNGVAIPPQPGEVRLNAVLVNIVRGARGPFGGNTVMTYRLEWYVNAQLTDVITVERQVEPGFTRPSVAQRIGIASQQAGQLAAVFFQREQSR